MKLLRASAPANLLLLGEYAVLEEGGLGVAIAADVRATATFEAAAKARKGGAAVSDNSPRQVRIDGIMPGRRVRWHSGANVRRSDAVAPDDKLEAMASFLTGEYGAPAGTFSIDTRALFRQDGAKRGYGSSAVTAALLTALWRHSTGPESPAPEPSDLVSTGIEAHRATQGGRGSGYDVASSLFGGTILFTGGKKPFAKRISLPWLTDLFLFSGPAPVRTPGAVGHYEVWKRENPHDAAQFFDTSNALVKAFTAATNKSEAVEIFRRYTELARELGEQIGVPATITTPSGALTESPAKAIGAGNELGIAWDLTANRERPMSDELERIHIASEGLEWL